MSAQTDYSALQNRRSAALDRARECAALTIPALLPPDGSNDTTSLPTPFQSVGAEGVNNLSSKILLALFPAGVAFARLVVPPGVAAENPESLAEIQKALAVLESRIMDKFETSVMRPMLAHIISHLIVTGNQLFYFKSTSEFQTYRLDQYVIRRDAMDNPIDAVVKQSVHPSTLSPEVIDACKVDEKSEKDVDIYTKIEWRGSRVSSWQEINELAVPESKGSWPVEKSPWMPLRWKAVPGSDYGRGHVEEYLGALTSLEGLSQSIVEFAAVASKILFLVHPNSTTDVAEVNRAESGEAVTGNKADIDTMQLDKYADFQVAEKVVASLETQLARAFLLRSAMTRDAERVTAEEIRAVAQELEDVLGGVYTVQANELQLPLVRRLMAVMTSKGELPTLPKGSVDPIIVSGFQALGRNQALTKLRGFIADFTGLFGAQAAPQYLKPIEIGTRLGVAWGIEGLDGIIKSQDEIAQEQQDAKNASMLQTLMEKGTGPMAKVMAEQGGGPMQAAAGNAQPQQ